MAAILWTLFPKVFHGHHAADDIFKDIFLYKNAWTVYEISLKYVPVYHLIHSKSALVYLMA